MKPLIEFQYRDVITQEVVDNIRSYEAVVSKVRKMLFVKVNYEVVFPLEEIKHGHVTLSWTPILEEIKDPQWQQVPEVLR